MKDFPMDLPKPNSSPFAITIPWWRQLRFRAAMAMAGLSLLVSGALFLTNFMMGRAEVLEQFQRRAEAIAGTGAVAINGDDLALIEFQLDYLTDEFQLARSLLEQIRVRNDLTREEIYVLRPVPGESDFETEFVVMTAESPYIANRYQIREENRPAFLRALKEGKVTSTDIYQSDVGEWISGYAPILNAANETVAVLEVAAKVDRYNDALRDKILIEAAVTGFALMIGLVAVFFLAGRLTSGIELLALAIKRFERGETDVKLELTSRDEIAAMAETFNSMAYSVGEKLKLLPFVSQFTAQAVEKSRYVDNWMEGQEREAAILMTDVRGFTRSAQDMAPADLLRQLNDLLALQTEVVVLHGGSVDKFMGDAVLAIFSGYPDNLERATRCGKELFSRVRTQTSDWPQSWALGGAMGQGKVIFGAVGSEARRDYTVIGNVVNRTAHLCGAAAPWEFLVTPEDWERLPDALQLIFPDEVPIKTKHEEEPKMMRSHRRSRLTSTPW
jgi:class 3 adenylate cyclase/HAMP domain-containing protein